MKGELMEGAVVDGGMDGCVGDRRGVDNGCVLGVGSKTALEVEGRGVDKGCVRCGWVVNGRLC